ITETRTTIMARDGVVLADTEADPKTMENHAGRPEVAAALAGKTGSATRLSRTVGIEFLYVAVPSGDKVVRLAYPLSSIQGHIAGIRQTLLRATALALLLALLLAIVIAEIIARRLRRIVDFAGKIAAGDLTARIEETSFDEIAQVATALDRTARRLQHSFAAVETGRKQLETLLNSMQDAVLAISSDGRVEWANGVMQRLTAGRVRLGARIVETVRDPDFLNAVE